MQVLRDLLRTCAYRWDEVYTPGFGYESGRYAPFLIDDLSIQALAAFLVSSVADMGDLSK